jgi:hypothetical protein
MKRGGLWIVGGVLVVALLAAAAFTASRLLNAGTPGSAGSGAAPDYGRVNPGSGKKAGVSITFDPAPELPKQLADLIGTVTQTKDNSIYVVTMTKGSDAVTPPQEVVVVRETRIYRDATLDNQPPSQSQHLQQVVETIPVTRISAQNVVEVWGQKRGERWIADVVVMHDR